ncbi:MAG TPA: SIR2 family protein [Gaiellaceae bacterium]|nr:SIR2 family protein [Gaiellaceae bacterium]
MLEDSLHAHYSVVIKGMFEGRVVPLLGAGVNLCGRPEGMVWKYGDPNHMPSGDELAEFLADYFEFPSKGRPDLARVSQYAAVIQGSGPLYEELHQLFDADYPPTSLHTFLAGLPAVQREVLGKAKYQLIVTTNYDDALERAFARAGEPYDVVTYEAEGEHRGAFFHWPYEEEPRLIERPNEYADIAQADRTVILKMHGAIDRRDPDRDSFVITEDHYIEYLARTDISNLIPVTLAAKLRKSAFLFLGYRMRDWNLRVILQRIWGEQRLSYKSWAIQLDPEAIEQEFWSKRGVDILRVSLEEYVECLERALRLPLGTGVGS